MEEAVKKAAVLIEALPYVRAFSGKVVVVKFGGAAMDDPEMIDRVLTDVSFMVAVGMRIVIVHGGGPRISAAMAEAGITPRKVMGLRITDEATMAIVARVLIDEISADIIARLEKLGQVGLGLNGRDHGFLLATKKRLPEEPEVDLGCVGEAVGIKTELGLAVLSGAMVPVVAPVATGAGGGLYNVNADEAAAVVAAELGAEKLVVLSDTPGVFADRNDPDSLLPTLDEGDIKDMIAAGTIDSGMIPKVGSCLAALKAGVAKAHIVSGYQPHALLLEIFTDRGVGTEIVHG